jgi:hypothetical protein
MSTLVFPNLPGMDVAIKRTPIYATKVQTASSGKELRASFQSTPRYRYSLPLNFLRQAVLNATNDEAAQLLAFFGTHKGKWDSFWLPDPMAVNLVSNGTSEETAPTGVGAQYLDTRWPYAGSKYRWVQAGIATTQVIYFTDFTACTAGEQIYYEAMSAVDPQTGAWRQVQVDYYDASQTWVNGTYATQRVSDGWLANFPTCYAKQSVLSTVPSSAVYFRLGGIAHGGDTQAVSAGWDNIFGCRASTAGLVAAPDGTLTQVIPSTDGIYMQLQRRVRFDTDELDFERFLAQVWEAKSLPFISVK